MPAKWTGNLPRSSVCNISPKRSLCGIISESVVGCGVGGNEDGVGRNELEGVAEAGFCPASEPKSVDDDDVREDDAFAGGSSSSSRGRFLDCNSVTRGASLTEMSSEMISL